MDIKLGYRTWYAGADPAAVAKWRAKDARTTQATLGFKICGMQVWRTPARGYWRAGKAWCNALTPEGAAAALVAFAWGGAGGGGGGGRSLSPATVYGGPRGAAAQLRRLLAWASAQREYQFYSSSVLLVYEGDPAPSRPPPPPAVRAVDFAHAFRVPPVGGRGVGGPDDNYAAGLASLVAALDRAAAADVRGAGELFFAGGGGGAGAQGRCGGGA